MYSPYQTSECRYRTSEAIQIASNTTKITVECLQPDTEYILHLTCRINGAGIPGPITVTKLNLFKVVINSDSR